MNKVKGYALANYHCEILDISGLVSSLKGKEIKKILFDPTIRTLSNEIFLVDEENPLVYTDHHFFPQTLCISFSYYQNHVEEIQAALAGVLSNLQGDSIQINDVALITEEVLQAILDNSFLKKIRLGTAEQPFIITEELYHRFKEAGKEEVKTDGVVPELKDTFDPLLSYNVKRKLVDTMNYNNMKKHKIWYFCRPLTEEEIFYLKYVNPITEFHFTSNDYENIFTSINRLRDCGHVGLLSVRIEDKNPLNQFLFSHLEDIRYTDNIQVYIHGETFALSTYMKSEKKLVDQVVPVLSLSPFEKYLYIYDLVCKYKEYKENNEDKQSARDLYQLLENDYIVCVGYTKLLCDLLSKVGISAQEYAVDVDTGLDGIPLDTLVLPDFISGGDPSSTREVITEGSGHSRALIHLVDPKYGIDGYYIADPTWDNIMNAYAFNYALMTHDEFENTDRYNYMNLDGIQELFFVHSLEEFYKKMNLLLDKHPMRTIFSYLHLFTDFFSTMDPLFYQELVKTYPSLLEFELHCDRREVQDILLAIGEHILAKTNCVVDGKQFKEGLTALFTKGVWSVFKGETIESQVEGIIEYNKNRHEQCFPTRYIIDRNGIEMKMMHVLNKFAIDEKLEPKM